MVHRIATGVLGFLAALWCAGCASMADRAGHELLFVVTDASAGKPPPPTPVQVIYGSENSEWSFFKANPLGKFGTTDSRGAVMLQVENYERTITLKVGDSSAKLAPSVLRDGGFVLVPPDAPRYRVQIIPRGGLD